MTDKKIINLGAERADRDADGSKWTALECLRHAVQQVESGAVPAERLVIVWQGPKVGDEDREIGLFHATPEPIVTVGLLQTGINMAMGQWGES